MNFEESFPPFTPDMPKMTTDREDISMRLFSFYRQGAAENDPFSVAQYPRYTEGRAAGVTAVPSKEPFQSACHLGRSFYSLDNCHCCY